MVFNPYANSLNKPSLMPYFMKYDKTYIIEKSEVSLFFNPFKLLVKTGNN
jgi:hypothetical protein